MGNERYNPTPRGDDNSKNETPDSTYALPEEASEMLNAWIVAKRLKKYRRMKELEVVGEWPKMSGDAKDFHASSPVNGVKVGETAAADALAFAGEVGPEVSFVDRETAEAEDTEPGDSEGMPVL